MRQIYRGFKRSTLTLWINVHWCWNICVCFRVSSGWDSGQRRVTTHTHTLITCSDASSPPARASSRTHSSETPHDPRTTVTWPQTQQALETWSTSGHVHIRLAVIVCATGVKPQHRLRHFPTAAPSFWFFIVIKDNLVQFENRHYN